MKVRYSAPMLWLNGALVVVVLGGGVTAYALVGSDPAAAVSRTTTVAKGTVLATVSGSGNVMIASQTSVNFGTSGKVTAIDVTLGEHVTAGQTLATLDPTTAQGTLNVAQEALTVAQDNLAKAEDPVNSAQQSVYSAQLAQDQTQINTAKSNLATAQANETTACASTGSATAAACTTAKNTVTQDTAQVTSAQDSYNTAVATQQAAETPDPSAVAQDQEAVTSAENTVTTDEQAVADATLTAPSAGTVLSISGAVGSTVSAGSTTTSGGSASTSSGSGSGGGSGSGSGSGTGSSTTTSGSSSSGSSSAFVTLGDMTHMDVTDDVSESDVAKISDGQQATVTLNALPNQTFGAKVVAISPTSTVVSNVVEYAVTLEFTSTLPASVRSGQTASIDIVTGEAANALYLPSSAITTVGGANVVTVVDKSGTRHAVDVTTGLVGDTDTQILSGLTQGESVMQTLSTSTTGGTTGRLGGAGLGGTGLGGLGTTGLGGTGLGGTGTGGRG